MRTRALLVAVGTLMVLSGCSGGADGGSPPPSSGPTTASASASPSPAEAQISTRLAAPSEGSFLVRGRYPRAESQCVSPEQPKLLARFPGTLRVRLAEDGLLSLTVSLPFERYLEGIAEVPPSWPTAALEAQAVAARSYALATTGWSGEEGQTLDQPICATTACQVYRGIPVPPDPTHRRWVRAVRRTAGQVLLHDGRPATTVYFSTSNGRTYGNEDVFGSDPLPYLRPVVEEDDGASGTSRWTVRIPFDDLARFLRTAERWPPGRRIESVRPRDDALFVGGRNARREISLTDVRDAVNTWGPCLEPGRYPGELPLTIPSRWWTPSVDGRELVATGRGWGHGAGMVQWGAYGKARRGFSAAEILAYYYGGLVPEPYPEPGTIHVIVASGLTKLTAIPSRPGARIDGRVLDHRRAVVVPTDEGISIRA
jgi:stage II sporulation protein D